MSAIRKGRSIQTYTGRQFWTMDPRPDEVDIEDIAHALSMICRYGGHCLRFYSVAEHCVLMARAVSPENALWALLHDAGETYLTDVPRPVKQFLPGYKEAEEAVMAAVCERFGLTPEMPAEVKAADSDILADETMQSMARASISIAKNRQPLGVTLQFWTPEQAKAEFLAMFKALTGEPACKWCGSPAALHPAPAPVKPNMSAADREYQPDYIIQTLAGLMRQMMRHVPKDSQWYGRATEYLKKHGLQGSPLRAAALHPAPATASSGGIVDEGGDLDCIRWYVECLQAVAFRKHPVRGLDEAEAGYKNALPSLEALSKQVAILMDRLAPGPHGEDKIDELESALDQLRHRAEAAEAKVADLTRSVSHLDALLEEARQEAKEADERIADLTKERGEWQGLSADFAAKHDAAEAALTDERSDMASVVQAAGPRAETDDIIDHVRKLAEKSRSADEAAEDDGLEKAISVVEKHYEEHCRECGVYDPSTNATEFSGAAEDVDIVYQNILEKLQSLRSARAARGEQP